VEWLERLLLPQRDGCERSGGDGKIGAPVCGLDRLAALRPRRRREKVVQPCRAMTILTAALALLAGCVSTSLGSSDRAQLCRIELDAKLPQPVAVVHPLLTESGAAIAAGYGLLQGLAAPPLAIVAIVAGAYAPTACAESFSRYPSAKADYERILGTANIGLFKQAVELELAEARSECRPAPAGTPASERPDAIVEIEKIESFMGCPDGKQEFAVKVHWRVVSTRSGRVLAASTTACLMTSFRSVGDWFADPGYAKAEIERLLEKAGEHVAVSLLGPVTPGRCVYRSREDGQLE